MNEIEVHPATLARFDDVATLLAPKNPDSAVCWCLTYRLSPKENRELGARERPDAHVGLALEDHVLVRLVAHDVEVVARRELGDVTQDQS